MPSTSEKQHRFMEVVAHSPEFAKKVDVPQSVGEEFVEADKNYTLFEDGKPKKKKSED